GNNLLPSKVGVKVNDLVESNGGKKTSSKSSLYEAPLGYSIDDVRSSSGIKKFRSAAYSNIIVQVLLADICIR
ncbi:hypothetical protein BC332_24059, partial [Capsicum chinense]